MFELGFGRVCAAVCGVLCGPVVLAAACSVVGVDAASAGAPAGNAGAGVGRVGLLAGSAVSMDRVFAPSFARFADTLRLSEAVGDGFDVQDLRFARSVGDESFYVAPSESGKSVCLVAVKGDESALSCGKASTFDVNRDVALASERADGTTRIVGVVPDGVSRVVSADGVVDVVAANVFVLASVHSGGYTLYGPGLSKPITQLFEGVGNTPASGSVVSGKQAQVQQVKSKCEKPQEGGEVKYVCNESLKPQIMRSDDVKESKSMNVMRALGAWDHVKIWYERSAPGNQRAGMHEGSGGLVGTDQRERVASAYCSNASTWHTLRADTCRYHN